MAGSLKWFVYTDDSGVDHAIWRDESNMESVNGGTQDYPDTGVSLNALPRNIKPRTLTYRSLDGLVSRSLAALTPAIYAGAAASVPSFTDATSGKVVYLVREKGEVRTRVPKGQDTGLTDGDAT